MVVTATVTVEPVVTVDAMSVQVICVPATLTFNAPAQMFDTEMAGPTKPEPTIVIVVSPRTGHATNAVSEPEHDGFTNDDTTGTGAIPTDAGLSVVLPPLVNTTTFNNVPTLVAANVHVIRVDVIARGPEQTPVLTLIVDVAPKKPVPVMVSVD